MTNSLFSLVRNPKKKPTKPLICNKPNKNTKMWVTIFKEMRWSTSILGALNITIIILGGILKSVGKKGCGSRGFAPFGLIMVGCCSRIIVMILAGIAQKATATMILKAALRHETRIRYARWLWWARCLMVITALQFVAATYLMIVVGKHLSHGRFSNCIIEHASKGGHWATILVLFVVLAVFVAIAQCFTGSDVLKWRSFYSTEDNAWKTHYREVFDHGIREALCCMGRIKYLSALDEDEVYSVAKLLGDLVAYRAAGTGHLELLAGLSLLQRYSQYPKSNEGCPEAPEERIRDATVFHPFAEAAYTGLLLDIGRNPLLFPCIWLSRQGILTPWTRNRRPVLEGDNWWRGHATAFLKYVKVSSDALRKGRVNQGKCEAAYFIVVLHHAKSVVIAVRGTETPEDLITDGLCRECILSATDLDGLINCSDSYIHPDLSQKVISSAPHYGHSGIVEAARDLFVQIEGRGEDGISSGSTGFLSSLLGEGGECEGYDIRIVGHSLGGAIAAFLGLRLIRLFPKLHVYAYGPLPCMDPIIAEACSPFVTSIVYGNEFSARLSVASILRLRASALTALSQSTNDTTITSKLARRFLLVSKYEGYIGEERSHPSNSNHIAVPTEKNLLKGYRRSKDASSVQEQESPIWQDIEESSQDEIKQNDSSEEFISPYSTHENISADPVSEFMDSVPSSGNDVSSVLPEMYLPGLIVHIVPLENSSRVPLWKRWRRKEKSWSYKAYIANREAFRDIIISPSMFLDHLPWRCDYAMKKVLETRSRERLDDGSQLA